MAVPISAQSRTARAHLAKAVQKHGNDAAEASEARRDFNAARLDDYIRETLAKAPPLTDEQRARLAELLRPVRVLGGVA
jgi:hypothetical protein